MEKVQLDKYLDMVDMKHHKFNFSIPTISQNGIESITDILIDEYHETELFIKNTFNSNKMEVL
tara:strand:- start:236 stop:424 length:189 start_codon:yes stop_codon:yes gene_type:complete